jgi:hypothetical protein
MVFKWALCMYVFIYIFIYIYENIYIYIYTDFNNDMVFHTPVLYD